MKHEIPADIVSALSLCQIRTGRRFELQELTEIFLGKAAGVVFWVFAMCNCLLNGWTMAQVAAGSWASNLPFKGTTLAKCSEEDFLLHVHPDGGCWNSYVICIVLFGLITLLLAWFDFYELSSITITITVLRFVVLSAMIVHSLVLSINRDQGHSAWKEFSTEGWLTAVPVMVTNQLFPLAIPTLIQPVSHKTKLPVMFMASLITTGLLYAAVGITVSVHFGAKTNEMANLNWVPYTDGSYNWAIRTMAYTIVLFPSIDATLNYIYQVIVLVHISESWIFSGHATFGRLTRFIHRFIASVIPLVGAIFVTNLVTITQYIGLTYCVLGFAIPALLQYRSRNIWMNKLCSLLEPPMAGDLSVTEEDSTESESTSLTARKPVHLPTADTPYSGWYSKPVLIYAFLVYSAVVTVVTIIGIAVTSN